MASNQMVHTSVCWVLIILIYWAEAYTLLGRTQKLMYLLIRKLD